MGLVTGLLTLPLAPARGAVWVAEQVAAEAERHLYDEDRVRAELLALELEAEDGLISPEEQELPRARAVRAASGAISRRCSAARSSRSARPPGSGAGAELPEDLTGLDPSAAPRLIRHGQLAAVVSPVPLADFGEQPLRERLSDMDWLERTVRAHQQLLDDVGAHATLIPMRLCSVYRDKRGVREMLAREAGALEPALAKLAGKTEWGVKVFATAGAGDSGAAESPRQATAAASGTDYMLRRRRQLDARHETDEQRYAACVAIHERLAAAAAAAVTSPPQRPEVSGHEGQMLLNGVYLVENARRDAFLELVDSLGGEHRAGGLELVPTGPWPPYHFVPDRLGAPR